MAYKILGLTLLFSLAACQSKMKASTLMNSATESVNQTLAPGPHVLTATVLDAAGQTRTVSIQIMVTK